MGFYLLIAVILLLTIFALRGGSDARDPVTYGQIRRLLEQQQVSNVVLEDNRVTLTLKEPQDGQYTVTYDVGDPDWFIQDFNDLIVEQYRSGIILDYDYRQGWVPPFWVSFLPWIAIIVVFFLLWYFMFLRQAGAGLPEEHEVPQQEEHHNDGDPRQEGHPEGGNPPLAVVIVQDDPAAVLLHNQVVEVLDEPVGVSHVIGDGILPVLGLFQGEGHPVVLQYHVGHLLLLQQAAYLAVGDRIPGVAAAPEREDGQEQDHGDEQVKAHIAEASSEFQAGHTSFPGRFRRSAKLIRPRTPRASAPLCRAGCGISRRSPGRTPPRSSRGW